MPATIVYPHQLFALHPALAPDRRVYLVEEPLLLTHNPIHRQKLIFHKLTLDAYERELTGSGYEVQRLTIKDHPTTTDVFAHLKANGINEIHVADTTDDFLETAIEKSGLTRVWYESPLFLLPKAEACKRFRTSKRFMASFYKQLRKDLNILLDENGEPLGGKWSFDDENRKKIPKGETLPDDIDFFGNSETVSAAKWAETIAARQYGEPGCWLPYTHEGAEKFLQEFLRTRFHHFGPYEDAMTTSGVRLWHSALSPLLNVGLLTSRQVLDEALSFAEKHDVPLNSLEGFVRQLIGWREFIRASYETDGPAMRNQNFWQHERPLPNSFWDGTSGLDPVDHVITTANQYGYTHHIERLMVMGNGMLLCELHPTAVYEWFMGMYLDAYDWVMVPNVYGMSQFADGGSFATKPYISGSNYIKKMSDFPSGDWEATWTALYWHFIDTHRTVFEANHRMSMMPRLLDKMDKAKRSVNQSLAEQFLQKLNN